MARRSKAKKRRGKSRRGGWWASRDVGRRRRFMHVTGLALATLACVAAVSIATTRLNQHVERDLLSRSGAATVQFVDRPGQLTDLCLSDLSASVADLLTRNWTDKRLCRDLAERLAETGWMARLNYVRRTADGRFEVSADYRLPFAMVQQSDTFLLVDNEGVRLPGTYLYDPAQKLIQGVAGATPQPGGSWEGDDIKAALAIVGAVAGEPFSGQITAVLVDNAGGRRDPRRAAIELATDRAGGRIRWGSAPGFEIEENSVGQKLAILRENYRQTGRVDAHHAIIDISTFPDRFTIPG